MYMYVYQMCACYSQQPQEGVGYPREFQILVSYYIVPGTEPRSSGQATNGLNLWTIPAAPVIQSYIKDASVFVVFPSISYYVLSIWDSSG